VLYFVVGTNGDLHHDMPRKVSAAMDHKTYLFFSFNQKNIPPSPFLPGGSKITSAIPGKNYIYEYSKKFQTTLSHFML
jgi:hypothetical protein